MLLLNNTYTLRALRGLDLNLLVLFDALMQSGKLTEAAQRIGLSQPAASQALSRLRASLGDELFVRARGGMVPTARARALAPDIRRALVLLERSLRDAEAFDPTTSTRAFVVAFGNVGEVTLLPKLLARLETTAPLTSVRSVDGSETTVLDALRHGEVDLFFSYAELTGPRIRSEALLTDELVVIARRGHPRVARRLGLRRFYEESHVRVRVSQRDRAHIEELLQHDGRTRRMVAEVLHYTAVPAAVLASDALAIVPRSLAEAQSFEPHLAIFKPPMRLEPLSVHMSWDVSLESDGRHTWFRQLVRDAVGR